MYSFKLKKTTPLKNKIKIVVAYKQEDRTYIIHKSFTFDLDNWQEKLSKVLHKFESLSSEIDKMNKSNTKINTDHRSVTVEATESIEIPILFKDYLSWDGVPLRMKISEILHYDENGNKSEIEYIPIKEKIKDF